MTITPIFPTRLKENIIPSRARDLLEIIKRGLESGRFIVRDGTIVLNKVDEDGKKSHTSR